MPFAGRWAEGHFRSHPIAVAKAYREGGHREDAKAHLEGFLSAHPVAPGSSLDRSRARQLADVHHMLGDILALEQNHREALSHFKAASHFGPRIARYNERRILGLAKAGQFAEALAEALAMRVEAPANVSLLALSGDVARIAGDEKAAAEAYEAAVAVDSGYLPVLQSLARLRAAADDQTVRDGAGAMRHAKALMDAPGAESNASYLATHAMAHRASGKRAEAEELFDRAIAIARRAGDEAVVREIESLAGLGR